MALTFTSLLTHFEGLSNSLPAFFRRFIRCKQKNLFFGKIQYLVVEVSILYKNFSVKQKDYILLLQIDSDNDIMWGDSSVANFFIHPDDLKKKDFPR